MPKSWARQDREWLADHLGVPQDRARQMGEQMAQLGAPEGIAYDYDAIRTTNTRRAHELIHVAKAHGRQAAMLDRLVARLDASGALLWQRRIRPMALESCLPA